MRFSASVVVFTVCIVALQCAANASDDQDGVQKVKDSGDAVVATTTTTPAHQGSAVELDTENGVRQVTREDGLQSNLGDSTAAAPTTTVTIAAKTLTQDVNNPAKAALQEPVKEDPAEEEPAAAEPEHDDKGDVDAADVLKDQSENPQQAVQPQAAAAPQTTTTTTVSVKTVELPDNSQTELQTPRTTTVVQTNSSPPSTPEREVAPGGHEPGKKNVGAPAKTTGDQSVSEARGARASVPAVEDSAVTPPTNIVKNNNGDNAGVQPNKHSGHKDTHQKQTPDATTTITEEQKASMDSSTTSSAAPKKETSPGMTSTLPKGFKIPQSVDKTDGISSVSVWFAFATLITLAVTAVAPVH